MKRLKYVSSLYATLPPTDQVGSPYKHPPIPIPMSYSEKKQVIKLADGKIITLETGVVAQQAEAAVLVRMGDAVLLAAVDSKEEAQPPNFLPLYVEYQEKYSGAGKIPGGFLKREGRSTAHEILIARIVDRIIRPCFPKTYRKAIQVNLVLLSASEEVVPQVLAPLAASAALSLSSLPFTGPISGACVGRIAGKFKVNPTPKELKQADMQIMVGGSKKRLLMVEGEMKEAKERDFIEAIKLAHETIALQCTAQEELMAGLPILKENYLPPEEDAALKAASHQVFYEACYAIAKQALNSKKKRGNAFKALRDRHLAELAQGDEERQALVERYFDAIKSAAVRDLAFQEGQRMDGRTADEIREIRIRPNYLPSAHGSVLFDRGETQALSRTTLGSKLDDQLIDGVGPKTYNKFMVHYNFPGFSTGEVKPNRGPNRREIGHANLAERAIRAVLPSTEENPFTLRVDTDILAANGSSSMATTCGSVLSLYNAGIQLKSPVAGLAIGLLYRPEDGKHVLLSDMSGEEDSLGDMDLKVAGTREGITAFQMDIKMTELSYELLEKALGQAKVGRLHILEKMEAALASDAFKPKKHIPKIVQFTIPGNMIGTVIGPGGKVVQSLQEETGTTISITESEKKPDSGTVQIFAPNQAALDQAHEHIKKLIMVPKIGEVYTGKVKGIREFGLFVELTPNKNGLLHISQVSHEKIENLDKMFKIGDEITVKLIAEKEKGKYSLSRKVLLDKPE